MKICVTSTGTSLDSPVDPRFGRAKYLLAIDVETDEVTAHDNTVNLNAMQGAGIQTARRVADMGVKTLITSQVGPKAFAVLEKAGVDIYTGATGTVQDALHAYVGGELTKAGKASVDGHWM